MAKPKSGPKMPKMIHEFCTCEPRPRGNNVQVAICQHCRAQRLQEFAKPTWVGDVETLGDLIIQRANLAYLVKAMRPGLAQYRRDVQVVSPRLLAALEKIEQDQQVFSDQRRATYFAVASTPDVKYPTPFLAVFLGLDDPDGPVPEGGRTDDDRYALEPWDHERMMSSVLFWRTPNAHFYDASGSLIPRPVAPSWVTGFACDPTRTIALNSAGQESG